MSKVEPYVKVICVRKIFKKNVVLKNVSLELEEGSVTGLVGPNGSGKTVLMKIICGLMEADKGSVFVDGKQVGKDIDFPEELGIIIETPGFISYMSGYDNLKGLAQLKKKIGPTEIEQAMKRLGLDPKDKKKVGKYSLGMRQRLGIAQAIMEDPKLLILDEPMNGLDKDGVQLVRDLILDLKNQGKCILLASHSGEDIRLLCDKMYEIDEGSLKGCEDGGLG